MSQVVSASKLTQALQKAQRVGVVEESFTLNGLDLVVRNLRPDEHEAILAECDGLDDIVYLHRLQKAHVARGLVEIDGENLRAVSFVEDEVQDDKGRVKKVRVELHQWLSTNVIETWGRESLYTVYRKVNDAIDNAERQAKAGVVFLVPDENEEERARRLLGEVREALEGLPTGIRRRVLEDNGLLEQSTADEIKAVQERLDAAQRAKEGLDENPLAQESAPEQEGPSEADVALLRQGLAQVDPPVRQPLNRMVDLAEPPSMPVAPPQGRAAALAQQAQQEAAHLGLDFPTPGEMAAAPPVEIRPQTRMDPKQAAAELAPILDQPPTVGLNPRFRRPLRLAHG